jgi:hypothetical protein
MELDVEPSGDSAVTLRWGSGPAGRRLARRGPGESAKWTVLREVESGPGEHEDWLSEAGPYECRLETDAGPGAVRSADIAPEVEVTLQDLLPDRGGARFRLTRGWKGRQVVAYADVAPGGSVKADGVIDGTRLPLDSRCVLRETRTHDLAEPSPEDVPRLLPDGRVERDAAGEPLLVRRDIPRPVRKLEADLADPSGAVRTVLRKMTDG